MAGLHLPAPKRADFSPQPHVEVLGVPIWNPDYQAFREWWQAALSADGTARILGIVNAHTLNLAFERPGFHACLRGMDVVLNDGLGAAIAAKMRGTEFIYNFNGTDLFPRLFSELDRTLRVYLYGSSVESNARAAKVLEERYPHVKVVGRLHGFADPDLAAYSIAHSGADLLLVALGQPRQELFLIEHGEALNVKVACGVGALFDFLSGTAQRAPSWVRRARMEWAYRLLREPVRLFRRYVVGNPKFLVRAALCARREAVETAVRRQATTAQLQ